MQERLKGLAEEARKNYSTLKKEWDEHQKIMNQFVPFENMVFQIDYCDEANRKNYAAQKEAAEAALAAASRKGQKARRRARQKRGWKGKGSHRKESQGKTWKTGYLPDIPRGPTDGRVRSTYSYNEASISIIQLEILGPVLSTWISFQ